MRVTVFVTPCYEIGQQDINRAGYSLKINSSKDEDKTPDVSNKNSGEIAPLIATKYVGDGASVFFINPDQTSKIGLIAITQLDQYNETRRIHTKAAQNLCFFPRVYIGQSSERDRFIAAVETAVNNGTYMKMQQYLDGPLPKKTFPQETKFVTDYYTSIGQKIPEGDPWVMGYEALMIPVFYKDASERVEKPENVIQAITDGSFFSQDKSVRAKLGLFVKAALSGDLFKTAAMKLIVEKENIRGNVL